MLHCAIKISTFTSSLFFSHICHKYTHICSFWTDEAILLRLYVQLCFRLARKRCTITIKNPQPFQLMKSNKNKTWPNPWDICSQVKGGKKYKSGNNKVDFNWKPLTTNKIFAQTTYSNVASFPHNEHKKKNKTSINHRFQYQHCPNLHTHDKTQQHKRLRTL